MIHFSYKSGKVRELESRKVRESQETLLKKLGGNRVLESQSSSYLNSSLSLAEMLNPVSCYFVSFTNMALRKGSSSCHCDSSSTSEGAKRLIESSSREIMFFLFALPGNFAGPIVLFPLGHWRKYQDLAYPY